MIQTNCQSDDVDGIPPADSYTLRNGRTTVQMPYQVDPTFAVASKFQEDEDEASFRIPETDDISSNFQEDALNDQEYVDLYNNDDANTDKDVKYTFYHDLDEEDDTYEDGAYDDGAYAEDYSMSDSSSEDDNINVNDNDDQSEPQDITTKDEGCGGSLRNMIKKLISPETGEDKTEGEQGHR